MKKKFLKAGDKDYRAYVGPPLEYDFMGLTQISLLYGLGLREDNIIFDIGCGSLRAGRLLIPFLNKGNYYGIEPNKKLLLSGIYNNIGFEMFIRKIPKFSFNDKFDFSKFKVNFDFIIAQSILSHTEFGMAKKMIDNVTQIMTEETIFLFTIILPSPQTAHMAKNPMGNNWIYPDCVAFDLEKISMIFEQNDLFLQKLSYYHPRQTWFMASKDMRYINDKSKIYEKHFTSNL